MFCAKVPLFYKISPGHVDWSNDRVAREGSGAVLHYIADVEIFFSNIFVEILRDSFKINGLIAQEYGLHLKVILRIIWLLKNAILKMIIG